VKWHFKTKQGIKNFFREPGWRAGRNGSGLFATRSFSRYQGRQVPEMAQCACKSCRKRCGDVSHNPFRPAQGVGRTRTTTPAHDGAVNCEYEPQSGKLFRGSGGQAAFEPRNVLPGHGLFAAGQNVAGRLISYPDAHAIGLAPNYDSLAGEQAQVPIPHLQQGRSDALRRETAVRR